MGDLFNAYSNKSLYVNGQSLIIIDSCVVIYRLFIRWHWP